MNTSVTAVPELPEVPIHIKLNQLSSDLQKLNDRQRLHLGVEAQMFIIDLSKPLDLGALHRMVLQTRPLSWHTLPNLSLLSTVFQENPIPKEIISNSQPFVLTNIEQFWERTLCISTMTVDKCDIHSNESISYASPYDISNSGRIDIVQESETNRPIGSYQKSRVSVHVPSMYFLKAYHKFIKNEHPNCTKKNVEKRLLQQIESFTGVKRTRMILRKGAKKKRTRCLVLPHAGILQKQWRLYVKQKYPDFKDEWKFSN
jgi:hypothetical protein